MAHLLELSDLSTFVSKTQIAGSFGNGKHKSLNVVVSVDKNGDICSMFTVESHKAEQLQTYSLVQAIKEYNKY